MRLLAPAKINLHLRVGPVESTGFHPLMSWFCAVGLFDTLTFHQSTVSVEPANAVSLTCDDPALLCDQTNLIIRAANAIQDEIVRSTPGQSVAPPRIDRFAVRLKKRIPSGGGLGGGSSDAARTLLGLNRLWKLDWPVSRLARLSAALGSDVPFFLFGPSSVCTGRGEIVHPIARPRPRWVVLILPGYAISTPAVYRKFDEMRLGDRDAIERQPDWKQWADLSAGPLLSRLVNDLEPPAMALCPELAKLRSDIEASIARPVRMSGSGSSLFTLFDENDEALSAAARIEEQYQVRTLATELAPPRIEDDLSD
jgi:4-diphosphocytidyl-2-C-methyl-D-erythritol kinase